MNESKFNFTTHSCVLFFIYVYFLLFCYQQDALINAGNSVVMCESKVLEVHIYFIVH